MTVQEQVLVKISAERFLWPKYLEAQSKIIGDHDNKYYASQRAGHLVDTGNELAFHFVGVGAAEKYQRWYDSLSTKQKFLFVSVESEKDLRELVECGSIPHTVDWFFK